MLKYGYFWTIPNKVKTMLGSSAPTPCVFAGPAPMPELVKYKSGDRNTIPAIVILHDGTPAIFVGDAVVVIRKTPRLPKAYNGAPILNDPVKEVEVLRGDSALPSR
jgi:hypothetical protein